MGELRRNLGEPDKRIKTNSHICREARAKPFSSFLDKSNNNASHNAATVTRHTWRRLQWRLYETKSGGGLLIASNSAFLDLTHPCNQHLTSRERDTRAKAYRRDLFRGPYHMIASFQCLSFRSAPVNLTRDREIHTSI